MGAVLALACGGARARGGSAADPALVRGHRWRVGRLAGGRAVVAAAVLSAPWRRTVGVLWTRRRAPWRPGTLLGDLRAGDRSPAASRPR